MVKTLVVMLLLLVAVGGSKETVIVIKLVQGGREYAERFASSRGLRLLPESESEHLPDGVRAFGATSSKRARSMAPELHADDEVEWHEIQEPRRRFTRLSAPRLGGERVAASDPLYASQWHLHGNANALQVETAWSSGVTGRGVVVAIVDDGVQVIHPDLDVDRTLSHDFNSGRGTDPSPYTTDGHGTSAAGVCCARRNNGQCGSGVAPEATLVGLRLIAEPTTDLQESQALSWQAASGVDVYSNSWGPIDDATSLDGPGRLTQLAFAQNAVHGRQGKGSIYVWAGGNGRENQDNCNYDGYANSIYTIAVGAIDHVGLQSWYSESCSALFVAGPSSGSGVGITTTDLTGRNGYAPGQCCNSFGGTSSAAPAVAGAVALLLQKRADLTWRDVQHVLAISAVLPPLEDQLVVANARGYKHSERFGFGRIDVPRMLASARTHTLVLPQRMVTLAPLGEKQPHSGNIREHGAVLHFTTSTPLAFIEHMTLKLSVVHPARGQLRVTLKSAENPETESHLFEPHTNDRHGNIPDSHTFMTVRHWGERLTGDATQVAFTLVVEDTLRNAYYGRGHLVTAQLFAYGY